MDIQALMQLAIEKAREGIQSGQSPFGCAIAIGEQVVACEHNTVLATTDATAHAEVNAIRAACRTVNQHFLADAVVATTCEPCPMCMAALHWARVKSVYFGASIVDATQAGFNELQLPAAEIVRLGGSPIQLIGDTQRNECRDLFALWKRNPRHVAY